MSKFNSNFKPEKIVADTHNRDGALAYSLSDREQLTHAVLTTFLSNEGKFYNSNEYKELASLAEKMVKKDWEFVAKLAIYARKTFGMRSVSHLLAAILVRYIKGEEKMRFVISNIVKRPDDMTEIFSCYIERYGKPVPNSLKKGFALSFARFDEYQLAKYKQDGKKVSLKDIMSISHPTPSNNEQSVLYGKVLAGTLETPMTWEVELSKAGADKKMVWKNLLSTKKLGYLALVRNLRNILEVADDSIRNMVVEQLTNSEVIKKVGIFPFTYYIAYTELKKTFPQERKILRALEEALDVSVANIPTLTGRTLIAVDVSGSMSDPISDRGNSTANTIANTLAGIADRICDRADILSFNTSVKSHEMGMSILQNINSLPRASGGTDVAAPLKWALNSGNKYDRIILISDNETNPQLSDHYGYSWRSSTSTMEALKALQSKNPKMWLHAIDVQGYGTVQAKGNKVNLIAGWSDKVMNFISLKEAGVGSLIQEIEKVNI